MSERISLHLNPLIDIKEKTSKSDKIHWSNIYSKIHIPLSCFAFLSLLQHIYAKSFI